MSFPGFNDRAMVPSNAACNVCGAITFETTDAGHFCTECGAQCNFAIEEMPEFEDDFTRSRGKRVRTTDTKERSVIRKVAMASLTPQQAVSARTAAVSFLECLQEILFVQIETIVQLIAPGLSTHNSPSNPTCPQTEDSDQRHLQAGAVRTAELLRCVIRDLWFRFLRSVRTLSTDQRKNALPLRGKASRIGVERKRQKTDTQKTSSSHQNGTQEATNALKQSRSGDAPTTHADTAISTAVAQTLFPFLGCHF